MTVGSIFAVLFVGYVGGFVFKLGNEEAHGGAVDVVLIPFIVSVAAMALLMLMGWGLAGVFA